MMYYMSALFIRLTYICIHALSYLMPRKSTYNIIKRFGEGPANSFSKGFIQEEHVTILNCFTCCYLSTQYLENEKVSFDQPYTSVINRMQTLI